MSQLGSDGRTDSSEEKNLSWLRVKLPVALLVLGLASYVVFLEVEANDESDEQIGPSAVWAPQAADLAQLNQACKTMQGQDYSRCFIEQMPSFGASPEAVSFTQMYAQRNRGAVAFLKGFRPVDAVDVGYAIFPAAADFNSRWLLLNGMPAVIDVDDLNLLPQAAMSRDPVYAALRKQYPRITLFDGDRSSEAVPASETLSDAGQRFVIDYPLKDQCRACTVLGQATFSFEFDASGRLLGVNFLRVTTVAPPAQK